MSGAPSTDGRARDRGYGGEPSARGGLPRPRPPRTRMLLRDRGVPALMEQQAIAQHAGQVRLRWTRTDRGAAQVVIAAEALIATGRHLPARLPDAICEIGFVPFGGTKGFVQHADAFDTFAP